MILRITKCFFFESKSYTNNINFLLINRTDKEELK